MTACGVTGGHGYGVHVSQQPHEDHDRDGRPDDDEDADDLEEHFRAHERDLDDARRTLDRVRRGMPYRRALWGFRAYYIGVLASVGSLIVSCFDSAEAPMLVVPIGLPVGILGYAFGHFQVREELRDFLAAAEPTVWHSRRDRKNLWQSAVFRDSFMGRLR